MSRQTDRHRQIVYSCLPWLQQYDTFTIKSSLVKSNQATLQEL